MDDIQRKLNLIDVQLAGWADSPKRILSGAPLLLPAIGFIAGILTQSLLASPQNDGTPLVSLWVALLALGAGAALTLILAHKTARIGKYAPVFLPLCVTVCFVCLGAIRLIAFNQPKPNDIRNFVGSERVLATIRGEIITEPHLDNQQWAFARFRFTDPGSSFYLKMRGVKTTDGWANVTGTVRARVGEPVPDLKAGDHIQAYCWLDRIKGPANPGQFNTTKYLARKNVYLAASVKSRDGIEQMNVKRTPVFLKLKNLLRDKARQALLSRPTPDEGDLGLLEALLLGDRRNVNRETYEAFRRTGLLHFISLSGMHLGILMGVVWCLCRAAGLLKPARAIICTIAIAIFLLIVPPRAPTVRAAIIGWIFCLSLLFRRRFSSLNTLSLAAIILLLIRPTQLFEAGWQLSFAAVLGIILFAGRIDAFLYEKVADNLWVQKLSMTNLFFRVPPALGSHLLKIFSVGLGAWLGGAGILLYHFYIINPLTSLFTVIVFPFVSAILTLGFAKIVLSFLLPSIALVLDVMLQAVTSCLVRIVSHISNLASGQILIGHVPVRPIVLYYALITSAVFAKFRYPVPKKAVCGTLILMLAVFLGWTKLQRTHREDFTLTCLDVGHGQAILVQLPGTSNLLFDAGSLNKSNIGERIVAPFLDYKGIGQIEVIIISHNDTDHINGIPEVVKSRDVHAIYAYDDFFRGLDQWGTARFLRESLRQQGHEIRRLRKNPAQTGQAKVEHLWPDESICRDQTVSENDKSLVTLIEFAGTEVLICSDIENFAQQRLLENHPHLKADIVIVPHHGSRKTLDPAFVQALKPEIQICSCSRSQYERLKANVTNNEGTFYTPRHGAVTVRIRRDSTVEVKTFVKSE